jgi:VIT1/CCC1 family predicted Fe2+/Mn2+ transporter
MTDITQYLKFYDDEHSSAFLYQTLSEVEKDPRLAEVYRRIAETELQHAADWASKVKDCGGSVPEFHPSWRTRALGWVARRFGMERNGAQGYSQVPGAAQMQNQEQSHGRLIGTITGSMRGGFQGSVLASLEGRHRATGGNALRAAVLGANDGMVSNLSLVMGVAGASLNNRAVLITGLAGLLAGAISMALGEWLSVQSSRELFSHQIAIETKEIELAPEEEAEELALIYEARGLSQEQARLLAGQILVNPESAVETLAREELGVNPDELGGSAWEAAFTSFFLFAVGAIVPVIPFFLFTGMTAVLVSILFSVVGLFILGAVVSLYTGRTVLYSGLRMVIFGLLAAAVTFGIGRLIGGSIGG